MTTYEVDRLWRTLCADEGAVVGVRGDKDVDVIRIRVPRVMGGTDLSSFSPRVHYCNAGGTLDYFDPSVTEDSETLTFEWLLGSLACAVEGRIAFSLELTDYGEDGSSVARRLNSATYGVGTIAPSVHSDTSIDVPQVVDVIERLENGLTEMHTALNGAAKATGEASQAAEDARKAAEEARGAVSPEMRLYLTYDSVGGTDFLTIVDTED